MSERNDDHNISASALAALQRIGLSRISLLGVGLACLALGVMAILLPLSLFGSLVWVLAAILIASGLIKASQFFVGFWRRATRWRDWLVVLAQVVLDLAMGFLLINHRIASAEVVVTLLGALFLVEGVILCGVGLKAPSERVRWWIWVAGIATAGLGLVIVFRWVPDPARWTGVFIGIKLIAFGIALLGVASVVGKSAVDVAYLAAVPEPDVAELYAVYFGTAFHLGVYIGNQEIVHYLNDNQVHRVSWETFLEGRVPQHWTYPDLPVVPAEEVVATALSEVGKTYPYNLLSFNCEHFAIFCKSGGRTITSKYAQTFSSMETVELHPVLGVVAELNTRLVEWLAFKLGGPSGKRLSLQIRKAGNAATAWLLARSRIAARKRA
jgi:uncharacterized membrane protein HdeD (DUF308 family)